MVVLIMINKKINNKSCYARLIDWCPPTFSEVQKTTDMLGLKPYEVAELIGVSATAMKRWRSIATTNPEAKSKIPYAIWCLLVYLTSERVIFADVIKDADLSLIDFSYVTSINDYQSPPISVMRKFVGAKSLTKLTRTPLSAVWGVNPATLLRDIAQNNMPFVMWCLLLVFVGVDVKKAVLNHENLV